MCIYYIYSVPTFSYPHSTVLKKFCYGFTQEAIQTRLGKSDSCEIKTNYNMNNLF